MKVFIFNDGQAKPGFWVGEGQVPKPNQKFWTEEELDEIRRKAGIVERPYSRTREQGRTANPWWWWLSEDHD
jgi:hypothetical protein